MQAKFEDRLKGGQEAEECVFSGLNKTNQNYKDTRDDLLQDGTRVKYDFIYNGAKYDIKRQYNKQSECIKVKIADSFGNPAGIYLPENDTDFYGFVERDNLSQFIIVPTGAIRDSISNMHGITETCKYDNTKGKVINRDFLKVYKVINI